MAGDDEAAKQVVSTLLVDLGFEPLDAGRRTHSPPNAALEPFAMVCINQALMRGHGRTGRLRRSPEGPTFYDGEKLLGLLRRDWTSSFPRFDFTLKFGKEA